MTHREFYIRQTGRCIVRRSASFILMLSTIGALTGCGGMTTIGSLTFSPDEERVAYATEDISWIIPFGTITGYLHWIDVADGSWVHTAQVYSYWGSAHGLGGRSIPDVTFNSDGSGVFMVGPYGETADLDFPKKKTSSADPSKARSEQESTAYNQHLGVATTQAAATDATSRAIHELSRLQPPGEIDGSMRLLGLADGDQCALLAIESGGKIIRNSLLDIQTGQLTDLTEKIHRLFPGEDRVLFRVANFPGWLGFSEHKGQVYLIDRGVTRAFLLTSSKTWVLSRNGKLIAETTLFNRVRVRPSEIPQLMP